MSRQSPTISSPSECPVCGCDVPPHSRACPGCGADENTGWNDEATRYDGIDLPESAFDDEHTPTSKVTLTRLTRTGLPVFTWLVSALLLIVIVFMLVHRLL